MPKLAIISPMSQLTPIENEQIRKAVSAAATVCLQRLAPGGCPEIAERNSFTAPSRLTIELVTEGAQTSFTTGCNGAECLISAACAVHNGGIKVVVANQ